MPKIGICQLILFFTECFEDFTRGLFWSVAYDGDTVAKPCRNVDERFRFVHIMLTTDSIGFYCTLRLVLLMVTNFSNSRK